MNAGHILVTSAAQKAPLIRAVQTAARRFDPAIQVIAGDADERALARYVADGFWPMPLTVDAGLDALITGCQTRGIRVIFPTRDGELTFWAGHQARFAEADITVVVSPAASVQVCRDKLAFARFGQEYGLPFIAAGQHPDDVGAGPYVVKPRYGAGGRKVALGLDREAALAFGGQLEQPIYQPYIVGMEISIDGWLDRDHQVKGVVLRTRDQVVGGESQVTTTFRDGALEAEASAILAALQLRGPVVMQALINDRGGLQVIECNARFGGASTAAIAVGLDEFYWSLLEAAGEEISACPFQRAAREIRQVRLPADGVFDGSGL